MIFISKMKEVRLSDYAIAVDYRFERVPEGRVTVNTINAYSWIMADKDEDFRKALTGSDFLLPDGVSIVWAARVLAGERIRKIAGADLHRMVLETLEREGGKCFYLGASEGTLERIRVRLSKEYPHVRMESYSPPFKPAFSDEDNREMIERINRFAPDALFVGMTAPKQEKWIAAHREELDARLACGIGAVFDFYAETKKRPPRWMIALGLEWLGRLLSDPKRLWRRYIIYNPVFVWKILRLKWVGKEEKEK